LERLKKLKTREDKNRPTPTNLIDIFYYPAPLALAVTGLGSQAHIVIIDCSIALILEKETGVMFDKTPPHTKVTMVLMPRVRETS
jgi:hypothetical protein